VNCEEVKAQVMGLPVGEYSEELTTHLRGCESCEEVYLEVRRLEMAFRREGLVQNTTQSRVSFLPIVAGAALALFLFFPFQTQGPSNPLTLPTTERMELALAYENEVREGWDGALEAIDVDPWEEVGSLYGDEYSEILRNGADEAYQVVHGSILEIYSTELEQENPWEFIPSYEG
jgi:hypothetical protein